jgi:hypothetical protein
MLEAGADFSLELDQGKGIWCSTFVDVVMDYSLVNKPIHSQL